VVERWTETPADETEGAVKYLKVYGLDASTSSEEERITEIEKKSEDKGDSRSLTLREPRIFWKKERSLGIEEAGEGTSGGARTRMECQKLV